MAKHGECIQIPLDCIETSPFQARQHIDAEAVQALAVQIQSVGLLHPITVRPIGERFQLLAGELRFRAMRDHTDSTTILAQVLCVTDKQSRRIGAIENWLRHDLSALEEIELVVDLVDDELLEDNLYLSLGKAPLERVYRLLSKLDVVRRSEGRGSTVSEDVLVLSNKFVGQVKIIFENLPKPMKWLSFFNHDLPLLRDICKSVQSDSVEQRLNKEQTRALAQVWGQAPKAYQRLVEHPEKALDSIPNSANKAHLRDYSAQAMRDYAQKHSSPVSASPPVLPPPALQQNAQVWKMNALGIPQERIAHQLGIKRKQVQRVIEQEGQAKQKIQSSLSHGHSPGAVAERHDYPLAWVWSIALEGLSDQERFKRLGWGLCTWDHLTWLDVDHRFGDDWPGRIPAQLVAHLLYYYTAPGELVMDPMAGGGVVADVCLLFGRKCWSFDLETQAHRPEIETHWWDLHQLCWPVPSREKPMLLFMDPPYFSKKAEDYAADSVSALSRNEYLAFFRAFFELAHRNTKQGGLLAFLNADWRDFQHKSALEENFEQSLTVVDYGLLLRETGWQGPIIWDCPLSTQRFHAGTVKSMQDARTVGVVRRSLMIAKRA